MLKILFRAVVACSVVASVPLSSQVPSLPADSEIQAVLDDSVRVGRARGIALGLLRPDGSRHLLVAGDAGAALGPVTPAHHFEIGSITKTFTGVLLAEAVRRGEVKPDDPVAMHLPRGTRVPSRRGRQITLTDLATHQSGLPRMPAEWVAADPLNPYAGYSVRNVLAFLAGHELQRDIGEAEYSNLGAAVLGIALVHAAGAKDFPTLVAERITRPLGLGQTAFSRPEAGMATGHDAAGKPVPYWDANGIAGAGGLNSTVDDLLTFLGAHAKPAATPLGASMAEAQKARRDIGKGVWKIGYFWQMREVNGRRIVSHGGATGGFGAFAAFDPHSGAAAVVLANSHDFDGDFVLRLLAPAVLSNYQVPPAKLAEYAGVFAVRPGFSIAVAVGNGHLVASATGQRRVELVPKAADRFAAPTIESTFAFERDPSGSVTSLTLVRNGRSTTAARIAEQPDVPTE